MAIRIATNYWQQPPGRLKQGTKPRHLGVKTRRKEEMLGKSVSGECRTWEEKQNSQILLKKITSSAILTVQENRRESEKNPSWHKGQLGGL